MENFKCCVLGPNPVSNIAPLVDSNNVTLEWPRPEGRVEMYIVRWWEASNSAHVNMKNITLNNTGSGPVRLLVGDLMPGVEYVFEIQAFSNDLESDITTLHTRTSKQITFATSLKYLITNSRHV